MLTLILMLLVILSAGIHIRAEYQGSRPIVYVFKPLTMVFILIVAMQGNEALPFYKHMIITGLMFSLAGDVFLMMPSDRFLPGLASFLIAHLFYITAFVSEINEVLWWPLFPFLVSAIAIYAFLSPSIHRIKFPVFAYILVISVMAWFSLEWWIQIQQGRAFSAFLGAVLFVVSDTALSINRFRGAFKSASVVILSTYFAAQWLIAGSI